jgi:hypothetical protein
LSVLLNQLRRRDKLRRDFLQTQSPASLDIIPEKMSGLRPEKLLRDYFDKLSAT